MAEVDISATISTPRDLVNKVIQNPFWETRFLFGSYILLAYIAPLLRFWPLHIFVLAIAFSLQISLPYARAAVLLSTPGNATHSLFCSILSFHDAISSHRFISV